MESSGFPLLHISYWETLAALKKDEQAFFIPL